jgi:hypothetical protein
MSCTDAGLLLQAVAPVAWCQPQYLHQLRTLLQSGELLSALPAGTSKELAVTYALQVGALSGVTAQQPPVFLAVHAGHLPSEHQ